MRTRRQSATLLSHYLQVAVVPMTRARAQVRRITICLITGFFWPFSRGCPARGIRLESRPMSISHVRFPALCLCALLLAATAQPAPAVTRPLRTASLSTRELRRELDSAETLLRAQLAALPEGSGVAIVREPGHLRLRIPARELFAADSAQFTAQAAKALPWSAVIALLRRQGRLQAQIFVYSDSIGGASLTQDFSGQRALALLAPLHAASIRRERVSAQGLGAAAELDVNNTPEGREQNRRVEVVFGPPEQPPPT
jgi:outer membrane protein OmpA-like peptidoglycan-associated protein